jgi:hypothetical protein
MPHYAGIVKCVFVQERLKFSCWAAEQIQGCYQEPGLLAQTGNMFDPWVAG